MTRCEKTVNAQLSSPAPGAEWPDEAILPSGALSTYLLHGLGLQSVCSWSHRVPGPLDPWPQIQWLCAHLASQLKTRFLPARGKTPSVSSAPTLGAWRSFHGPRWQVEDGHSRCLERFRIRGLGASTVGSSLLSWASESPLPLTSHGAVSPLCFLQTYLPTPAAFRTSCSGSKRQKEACPALFLLCGAMAPGILSKTQI